MSRTTSVRFITMSVIALGITALLGALTPAQAEASQPYQYVASTPCPYFSVQNVLDDPNSDWDGDRVTNVVELYNGLKPCVADSSNFCATSPAQCIVPLVVYGCNYAYWSWASVNSDPNGDWDRDGVSNAVEVYQGTNPCDARSYVHPYHNPCPYWTQAYVNAMPNYDWDGDGVTNAKEVWRGTNPCQYNAPVVYVPYVYAPQRLPHVGYTAYTYTPPPPPRPRCPYGYPYYHPGNGLCYANPVARW